MCGEKEHMWTELMKTFEPQGSENEVTSAPHKRATTIDLECGTPKVAKPLRLETNNAVTEFVVDSNVVPPDVMSTNKGKSKYLNRGSVAAISQELNKEPISGRTSKGSCSSVKRSIDF